MPRFSAEQRKKLKAELLENDDDMDDDDVLKPSLLHPSNRNISQLSPQMNTVSKQEKVEESGRTFTQKEIEEQATKNAQDAIERVLSIKCFPKISKATDLKWLRTGQKIWPVFVNNDSSNAQLVNVKHGNKQIIEYVGNRLLDKSTIQAVSARNLSDYHNGNDEKSWSPGCMASYTKQIKRYKPFVDKKGQDQHRMILEEQFFLDLLLKKQLQMDEKPETDKNIDDDDDDKEETFRYTASEEPITVTPTTPPSTPGSHRFLTDAEMNAQCRKLRAGDVIEYVHPVFQSQRQKAMIMKAMPPNASRKNDNDVVLILSDGMVLQRETEVRLVKRFLRGTLVDNHGAVPMFLWDFKLNASQNGKFKESDYEQMSGGKSMAEKMQEAYDEANDQVEQELMKLANLESDNNETEPKLQCNRKRVRPEADASVEDEAGQRTPSRPKL